MTSFAGVRRPIDLSRLDAVEERSDPGAPPCLRAAADGLDLAGWAAAHRGRIDAALAVGGAMLFRGFAVAEVADFERAAEALCFDLYAGYGDLPRERLGGRIYGSTPYPPDRPILFHNEGSHTGQWPGRIVFCCRVAPARGGATPTADGRRVWAALSPATRRLFSERALRYTRNFTPGLDVDWKDFFRTDAKAAVEERCRAEGIDVEWRPGGGLRTREVRPAVLRRGGAPVFFNQMLLHHPACLPPDVREALASLGPQEDFPRHVAFGDGSPIPEGVVEEVARALETSAVEAPWEKGDVLLVDNVLAAHGRRAFAGERKIVVAMGAMETSA
jgi:alpha-ketoglutarate-dependent taurine dioxygenase